MLVWYTYCIALGEMLRDSPRNGGPGGTTRQVLHLFSKGFFNLKEVIF